MYLTIWREKVLLSLYFLKLMATKSLQLNENLAIKRQTMKLHESTQIAHKTSIKFVDMIKYTVFNKFKEQSLHILKTP